MQASVTRNPRNGVGASRPMLRATGGRLSRLQKLNRLLVTVGESNAFYRRKWEMANVRQRGLSSIEQLAEYPFTTREELLADQISSPPLGTNHTFALEKYKHVFASSGTTRSRLLWADTSESWEWVTSCSRELFFIAGVTEDDRVLVALNFSASSGPWIMRGGMEKMNCCYFVAGGSDAETQLDCLLRFRPNVLVIAPAALNALTDTAQSRGKNLKNMGVGKIISFGKDGCDFEAVRSLANNVWHCEAFNRYGMTEAGSVAAECPYHTGLHLLDEHFIAETVNPKTFQPVPDDQPGELVLTTLGRVAQPIIRYRTGDMVRIQRNYVCPCGRQGHMLAGGVHRAA